MFDVSQFPDCDFLHERYAVENWIKETKKTLSIEFQLGKETIML